MKIENDIDLSKKTTFRIGGVAKYFYIPDSIDELIGVLNRLDKNYYVLSGGSNILINEQSSISHVISMQNVDDSLVYKGNGVFNIGASCRIQSVIAYVNERGYGGFEELIGLPALFGGVIYMNAGIGSRNNVLFSISDYIIRVKCFDKNKKEIVWLDKSDCDYHYRSSAFMKDEYIILGAEILCKAQTTDVSNERIKRRKNIVKNNQEWGKGCFGSIFSESDRRLLKIASRIFRIKNRSIGISSKNPNWIYNKGSATFKDTIQYIQLCEKLHAMAGKSIQREIRIWS